MAWRNESRQWSWWNLGNDQYVGWRWSGGNVHGDAAHADYPVVAVVLCVDRAPAAALQVGPRLVVFFVHGCEVVLHHEAGFLGGMAGVARAGEDAQEPDGVEAQGEEEDEGGDDAELVALSRWNCESVPLFLPRGKR